MRGVTKPDFRPCSTCSSRSQAPFYLCAQWLVSIQPEGTVGRLRYSLGGDRPSQTTRQTLSRLRLVQSCAKSGISPLPPRKPKLALLRLPPILRMPQPRTTSSYSKAPRGLFVLMEVSRIFTATSISPSPSLRQRSDRYAFRAGRNLPDKEFRYLRTVIVTAAVHWGFTSRREPLRLTFQHWAGISPYTSPFGFAET